MKSRFSADKRRHFRYELLDIAQVRTDESSTRVVVVDLSLGGVQIRCRRPMRVGFPCEVVLNRSGERSVALRGEVRHTGSLPNSDLHMAGVKFTPRSCSEQLAIVELVHEVFQQQYDSLDG